MTLPPRKFGTSGERQMHSPIGMVDVPRVLPTRVRDAAAWWRGTAALTLLLTLTTAAFVALALAAHRTPYFAVDLTIAQGMQSVSSPWIDKVVEGVAWPGFPPQSNVIF